MELWTEYEGCTIDGAFTLEKLLLPEGRSAFFSTSNGNGVPTLIRLIASHFDEEEILARWRGVEALGHPNILKIERYGQLVLDDTTVVYANFEPVDASLADVIVGQRLTVPEAKQLALSLASALEALHANGFVHEHVEPAKVFAVGEVVKLRGDCIRETPEGVAGQDAKKKDIHDLAVVVLLAVAQTDRLEEAARMTPLPWPLDAIVRNGLNGTWGLGQMVRELGGGRAAVSEVPAAPADIAPASQPAEPALPSEAPASRAEAPVARVSDAPRVSDASQTRKEFAGRSPQPAVEQQPPEPAAARGKFVPPGQRRHFEEEEPERRGLPSGKWMVAAGLAVIVALWLIWHVSHSRSEAKSPNPQGSSIGSASAVSPGSGQAGAVPAEAGQAPMAKPSAAGHSTLTKNPLPSQQNAGAASREQWRVVAFTYNRQDQAQKKVDTIAQKHAGLRPGVFTPTGRAPYLVTVGGVMSRDQAFAFAQQARKQGLPRDTYAQNYSGKRN